MNTYERDGVTYEIRANSCTITHIDDSNNDKTQKNIFIPDEINGKAVVLFGFSTIVTDWGDIRVNVKATEKIFFPWCIANVPICNWPVGYEYNILKYIVSASVNQLISTTEIKCGAKYVVPQLTYTMLVNGEAIGGVRVSSSKMKNFLPANISYKFNYSGNPNEGYFFIDLLEESGKLTKPPYDPKREGYTFAGWYIDAECTKEWNFETDEVVINFDEEGNRIYEEFCLYAKWTE